jgi:hypothetical protein
VKQYDPEKTPDPKEWLALDEWERTNLIVDYHDSADVELPNTKLHALFHTIVENQIATGEKVPARTLQRLMKEGLDRHEAIHAVGSVLGEQIHNILTGSSSGIDIDKRYVRKLESLTAEGWLNT